MDELEGASQPSMGDCMYNEQAFKIFQSYLYSKRGKKM
jgi:hypothetical protein